MTEQANDQDNELEIETQRILMVDDVPENLVALDVVLEDLDCDLIKANSGQEALAVLLKQEVSLVLLDVQMPEMDGFEVAELMRQSSKTKHIPIIFVTAISKEQRYVQQGYKVGAVDYLFKPIDPIILRSKVSFFLSLDKQKKRLEAKLRASRQSEMAFQDAMNK